MSEQDGISLKDSSADARYPDSTGQPTSIPPQAEGGHVRPKGLGAMLAALGVVYGDIGTSPLYALQSSIRTVGTETHPAQTWEVIGLTSLTFWALMLIVTIKYVMLVMRADHNKEGGIIALMALAQRVCKSTYFRWVFGLIGIAGACLFFGDGIITPAISVLSAVEGVEVSVPEASPFIIPAAIMVLLGLFAAQALGTGKIGRAFGPIMLVWFITIALLGARAITLHPGIILALSPLEAIRFIVTHGKLSFVALGSVVLSVTGAEALYADMGHFGRSPIRYVWIFLVLPALTLNYFGQAAMIIHNPTTLANPFYYLAPHWMQIPMLLLATCATIIASQAGISGSFSLCRQLIQLGYLPRTRIIHTNPHEEAQIYLPSFNWMLAFGAVVLVLAFRSSSALASAYGIAVTGTFLCTCVLAMVVFHRVFQWKSYAVGVVFGFFFLLDGVFFSANVMKIPEGGWVPLSIAAGSTLIMTTWQRGRQLIRNTKKRDAVPMGSFITRLTQSRTIRVPGLAVFLTSDPEMVPDALLYNLRHNKVLHQTVLFVTVQTLDQPEVEAAERMTVKELSPGIRRVILRYGFMEMPNLPVTLAQMTEMDFDPIQASYFTSHDLVFRSKVPKMSLWRMWIFLYLLNNATSISEFFRIPPERVMEFGVRVAI